MKEKKQLLSLVRWVKERKKSAVTLRNVRDSDRALTPRSQGRFCAEMHAAGRPLPQPCNHLEIPQPLVPCRGSGTTIHLAISHFYSARCKATAKLHLQYYRGRKEREWVAECERQTEGESERNRRRERIKKRE